MHLKWFTVVNILSKYPGRNCSKISPANLLETASSLGPTNGDKGQKDFKNAKECSSRTLNATVWSWRATVSVCFRLCCYFEEDKGISEPSCKVLGGETLIKSFVHMARVVI